MSAVGRVIFDVQLVTADPGRETEVLTLLFVESEGEVGAFSEALWRGGCACSGMVYCRGI